MDECLVIFILMTCIKFLLIPAYRSTDFEVHRNWLAITHSLPIERWYIDTTSQWTLDYPPLFAWFEYFLSWPAKFVDSKMLDVGNLNYCSWPTVVFHRLTVICADFVLFIGALLCSSKCPGADTGLGSGRVRLCLLVLASPALLLVDHVHFQYNGLLLGLLLISIGFAQQGEYLKCALVFSILLNMKHIFLYVAPAYFVLLLRVYCLDIPHNKYLPRIRFVNCVKLAAVLSFVFGVSLAPFIVSGQLPQLVARLFPFKRGLSHAYWAPNMWAIYNVLDKFLLASSRLTGVPSVSPDAATAVGALTGGLVQDSDPSVLPAVRPLTTLLLSTVAMLPALVELWRRPQRPAALASAVTHCAAAAFLFGWHVHEKAVLLVLMPLAVVSVRSHSALRVHCRMSVIAVCSVLPLLPTAAAETPFKLVLVAVHAAALPVLFALPPTRGVDGKCWRFYLCILTAVCVYAEVLHDFFFWKDRWPFLPLLLMSLTCAVGVVYCWLDLLRPFFVTSRLSICSTNSTRISKMRRS